ncbi:hypothetical protein NC651_013611 [Populus alba x Populus x berolinensis]|nr:hypothetical protein NC651_013611 [Populus alba x Populus x berolinensis]
MAREDKHFPSFSTTHYDHLPSMTKTPSSTGGISQTILRRSRVILEHLHSLYERVDEHCSNVNSPFLSLCNNNIPP